MFKNRKTVSDEDRPTYKTQYISYVIEGFGYRHLIHVRDTKEAAVRDCEKYQHVGPTEVEEQLKRIVYQATKTAPCKREE